MDDRLLQHRLDLGLDLLRVGQSKIAIKQLSDIINFEKRDYDFDVINQIGEAVSVCMTEQEQHDFWKKILAMRLDRAKGLIPTEILQKKKILVWFFDRGQAIGHLGREPWFLSNLYKDKYNEIVIIGKPRSENVNTAVFDIMMDGITYIETTDYSLIELSRFNVGLISLGNIDFYMYSYPYICKDFHYNAYKTNKFSYLRLSDEMLARGEALKQKIGIPSDAKIVVLHVRENSRSQHQRDVNIANYFDAIKMLVKKGYFIVRLGDKNMPALPINDLGGNIIDCPYNEHYEPFFEVYFMHECEFMVMSSSGPDELAKCMGKKLVAVNGDIHFCYSPSEMELMSFIKYKYKDTGRYIGYEEFLENNFYTPKTNEEFASLDIFTEQLSSNEILAIVSEMVGRIERQDNIPHDSNYQKEFERISAEENQRATTIREYKWIDRHRNWFGMGESAGKFIISEAYCELCPWFL